MTQSFVVFAFRLSLLLRPVSCHTTRVSRSLELARPFLGKAVTVIIDRPLGSVHPREKDLIYPVNYGYIADVAAPDGEDLDAYVLGVDKPLETFTGVCLAIIHRLNDDDDKLVITPDKTNLSTEEILEAVYFQEQFFKSIIVRK
jgi:inorganic pyrophosphatase